MYIMSVCLFSALSRRVGALQISIIIIIINGGCQWHRAIFDVRKSVIEFNPQENLKLLV